MSQVESELDERWIKQFVRLALFSTSHEAPLSRKDIGIKGNLISTPWYVLLCMITDVFVYPNPNYMAPEKQPFKENQ
jgi:hypothetical protein